MLIVTCPVYAQTSAVIFSHNDYLQQKPFESAYSLGVGYVEADVFLQNDKLMVAHTTSEISGDRTLENLYLDPIKLKIKKNNGQIFSSAEQKLTLMIDLKTEGIATLNAIVKSLARYSSVTTCKTLTIAISGNVPDTSQWKNYPEYITFDGRPNRVYSEKHLQRVSFISDSFRNYSQWNGAGKITDSDLKTLTNVITSVHRQGKKIRFWGAPDGTDCWDTFLRLSVDILGTDKPEELDHYLKNH